MGIADAFALVLMVLGALQTLVASVGLIRFDNVLMRMHSASKPQTLGLILIMLGTAIAIGTVPGVLLVLLVLLAQMSTVPVASTMLARAAFRRGFVRGGEYAIDELTPRLARSLDEDVDEDGFVDEVEQGSIGAGFDQATDRFPVNEVREARDDTDLSVHVNWEHPEIEPLHDESEMDIDESDLRDPAEVAEAEAAERRRRS